MHASYLVGVGVLECVCEHTCTRTHTHRWNEIGYWMLLFEVI